MIRTHFFGNKNTNTERITQTMDESNFFSQNKYITLQRTNDYHSFCDKYITSRDGWHKSGEINKLP